MTFIYQLKTVCSFKVRTFVSRHFNFWNMDIASLIYTEEGYSLIIYGNRVQPLRFPRKYEINSSMLSMYISRWQMACYAWNTYTTALPWNNNITHRLQRNSFSPPCWIIVVGKVMKSFWFTAKYEKKGEYF